ncbi:MAG: transposase [Oscillospiraceae bacterium]|nr:transposase [Oscillospiraceae bacterium]
MDFPQRKRTRLKGYDYSQQGVYFITVCTKNRVCSLCKVCVGDGVLDVPQIQLTRWGQAVETRIREINKIYSHIRIDKYVVMPNHIHMLVFLSEHNGTSRTPSPTNASLPQLVSTFKRMVNRSCETNIFQRSFHDHIIRNNEDYLRIWNYIDTNPATWEKDCFYIDN